MQRKTKLGALLESRRKTTPISTYAEHLRIPRTSYYRILRGEDVAIATLAKISQALEMSDRSLVLLAYCGTDEILEGAPHPAALRLLLKRQRGACYNPGILRNRQHTIRVLRAIAKQKPMVDGRSITLADLVLAAYFNELPPCIFD